MHYLASARCMATRSSRIVRIGTIRDGAPGCRRRAGGNQPVCTIDSVPFTVANLLLVACCSQEAEGVTLGSSNLSAQSATCLNTHTAAQLVRASVGAGGKCHACHRPRKRTSD